MPASTHRVKSLVNQVRRRWRRRALLQGVSLTLLTLVFFTALFLLLYMQTNIAMQTLTIGLIVGGLVVLYVAAKYLAAPLLKKLDDRQIAMYVEERIPGLEDRLNSAVEVGSTREFSGDLIDRLIDDASRQVNAIPVTTVVDQKKQKFLSIATAGGVLLFLIFGYNASDEIISAFSGAKVSMAATPEIPYMSVAPGNVEIEKGESQEIIVALRDETEIDVLLHYKIGDGEWQKESMRKSIGNDAYLYEFINLQEPVQYFVLHEQVESERFGISLYEFPAVARIDLRYSYPSYTGLPARDEANQGDIRGLKGSQVNVAINTTGAVVTAEMVFDDGRRQSLNGAGDGTFRTQITLNENDYYHIELIDQVGKSNKFPEEYQIIAVEDEKPVITINDPQRDVRVNAIEEVLIAAQASDDYGVKNLRLHLSVNGEDEEVHVLGGEGAPNKQELSGDYLVFLEDYTLEPGDIISYYLEAEDYFDAHTAEASDMYFIEVTPFDQRFTQQNNQGGMPGGGGMQSRTVISQQEIIAATWRLHRERESLNDEEFEQGREGLERAQQNLKENIEERISSTAFSVELQSSEESQKIVEFLRNAVDAMDEAIDELADAELEDALKPERKALNFLLRADALNRDRQVAMNRNQQGGGGGGGSMEDRMTELMDLELDISRDKYEVQQQQNQQGGQGQEGMDETLNRIKELARRQQRMANQRQRELEGEDKKRYIERLQRDQDELRRQTEQLAQNLQNQSASQSGQQGQQQEMQEGLQRAIDSMREAERALRNGDEQRAAASQQQALNELDKMQQQLRVAGAETTREMLDEFARDFDELKEQESQLGEDIEQAFNNARQNNGRITREEVERLSENRRNMTSRLEQFERQAEAVEEATRSEDTEVASSMRNLVRQMRRDELEKKMEDSQKALDSGWLDFAERVQEDIESSMERMSTQVRELQNQLPQTDEEQLRRAMADLQDLRERIEAMENQATQPGQEQQPGQAGQPGASGQPGQSGDRNQRAQAARMERQLEQAEEAMERLDGQLGENEGFQRMLRQARNTLNNVADASNTGVLLDEESAKQFFNKDVYNPLSELEMQLARELDVIEMEKKLFGARNAPVPDEYREAVDRYYESLSKSNNE